MADFISQLSGREMDSALQEVNAHNAEAWSSGTRGGVQVASGDPTYNNNAKYYANNASAAIRNGVQRAEEAANRAESAIPTDVRSAVLFTVNQTLSAQEKQRAQSNIGLGLGFYIDADGDLCQYE